MSKTKQSSETENKQRAAPQLESLLDNMRGGNTHSETQFHPEPFAAIVNAPKERRVLEKSSNGWVSQLVGSLRAEIPGISLKVFEKRIIEIYRICYRDVFQPEERYKVVRDFAAHFPHLLFCSPWLSDLVTKSHYQGVGRGTPQFNLFQAIAAGLRSAASGTRYKRQMRAMKLAAARIARYRLHQELTSWNKGLDRSSDPDEEWLREQAEEKTRELVIANSQLGRSQDRLQNMLQRGHIYEASVLATALIFKVRQRDLQ